MHQYTADLANRMRHHFDVHVVTTTNFPADRYDPAGNIHTPITTTSTSRLTFRQIRQIQAQISTIKPDVVHFTGPHLFNLWLLRWLKRQNIPTIHNIHDVHPHSGTRYGQTLLIWNRLVMRWADEIVVHGKCFLPQIQAHNNNTTYLPLLHLFLSFGETQAVQHRPVTYEPFALFFGRLEKYKGLDTLLTAWEQVSTGELIIAGKGNLPTQSVPDSVTVYNDLISDELALDLFLRCSLVVLPYRDATQSALIPAAYYFKKPVLITRTGALPEYMVENETGFVVEPSRPGQLATCLNKALQHPEQLHNMGEAGRAWYDRQRKQETADLQDLYHKYQNPTYNNFVID